MTIFTKNLKRFRVAKNMTQEQLANALGVSPQTVSRWECGTTLPDVSILPELARLYCVTIDDLYRETSVAYDNYAARLCSVYEATRQPEDYLRAEQEYRKLLKSGNFTNEDLRSYGILHQYMMSYCMEKAEELFDRVLKQGSMREPETYWSVMRQKTYFLHQIGRNQETIDRFLPLVRSGSKEVQDWVCLIQGYHFAEEYDIALGWAEKAEQHFPDNACLHIYYGDLCKAVGQIDEAFHHWKRARELEPDWMSAAYSMGFCFEELGEYEQAYAVWMDITDWLVNRGYEAEVAFPRERARFCKEKGTE